MAVKVWALVARDEQAVMAWAESNFIALAWVMRPYEGTKVVQVTLPWYYMFALGGVIERRICRELGMRWDGDLYLHL